MKMLAAAQQQAHDRMMASLAVTFHAQRPAEPSAKDVARRAATTAKMLQSRKLNSRTNTWCPPDPTPKRSYVRR